MSNKLTSSIILEYLDKYPYMQNLTLAKRIFYGDFGHLWQGKDDTAIIEKIRNMIRTYRGKNGKQAKKEVKINRHYDDKIVPEVRESVAQYMKPFCFSSNDNKIYLGADTQIPFHDKRAIDEWFRYGLMINPTTILLNGDIMDFYEHSVFLKNPSMMNIKGAIDTGVAFIRYVREQFPKCRIVWKIGNHEFRLERWAYNKPELFGLQIAHLNLTKLFGLNDLGIELVRPYQKMQVGPHLTGFHGHELKLTSIQVNPARSAYLKAKCCCFVSHSHRDSSHTEKTSQGQYISTWSTGCLCNLEPEFCSENSWTHGGATINYDGKKDFQFRINKIVNYTVQ